jgi:hypothetical protein
VKAWHMICEVCGCKGPQHEHPIESIRLAEDQGWGSLDDPPLSLNVCPECRANPAQALATWRAKGKPMEATVVTE